jgi:hypothetical protein
VDLATLDGSNGFVIESTTAGDELGTVVSDAGDFNGDGMDDVIVTAPQGYPGASGLGVVHVVYGSTSGFAAAVSVDSLDGSNGRSIPGIRDDQWLGTAASGLGDVNGDGIDDVIVGEAADAALAENGARAYVVFGAAGTSSTFDLTTLNGSNGFAISPSAVASPAPLAVGRAGDVNGDGLADLLVGSPATTVDTTDIPGGGFVLFGQDTAYAALETLSSLDGSDGFKIEGEGVFGQAGESVAGAGDINQDGLDDVIVGAPFASPAGQSFAGTAYVVFGRGTTFSSGTGAIDQTLDLAAGDQVIYQVSATIAAGATGSTTVTAEATVDAADTDTVPGNNTASATTTIGAPPLVTSIQINDGGASRSQITSLTVTFDAVVDPALLDSAFVIHQIHADAADVLVDTLQVSADSSSGVTVATLTFEVTESNSAATVDRDGTGALGDSLADGNYRLDILAANVVADGIAMEANVEFGGQTAGETPNDDFFRLYGDASGDGRTFLEDLDNSFAPSFFLNEDDVGFNASVDGDGDGRIDLVDLDNYFAPNFFASRE